MQITCPQCFAVYEIADNIFRKTGRDVECSDCGNSWYQTSLNLLVDETIVQNVSGLKPYSTASKVREIKQHKNPTKSGQDDVKPKTENYKNTINPTVSQDRPTPQQADRITDENLIKNVKQESDSKEQNTTPRITHANRETRHDVRVQLPASLIFELQEYSCEDVSLSGFSCETNNGELLLEAGLCKIQFSLDGYQVSFELKVRRMWTDNEGGTAGFMITDIEAPQAAIFRRVLRAYLSGINLPVEEAITKHDTETPLNEATDHAEPTLGARMLRMLRIIAYGTISFGIMCLFAGALYEKFYIMKSNFAAITAPAIEIRAPGDGLIQEHNHKVGERVKRDEILVTVDSPTIDQELANSIAALDYLLKINGSSTIKTKELEAHDGKSTDEILTSEILNNDTSKMASSLVQMGNYSNATEGMPALHLEAAIELERSKLSAIKTRNSKQTLYVPCDCFIEWVLPARTWVEKGETMMRLTAPNKGNLLVEALIPLKHISQLRDGQVVQVKLDDVNEAVEGRIIKVTLDREREPRSGFPDWLQMDESVGSILIATNFDFRASDVGRPVEVEVKYGSPYIHGFMGNFEYYFSQLKLSLFNFLSIRR